MVNPQLYDSLNGATREFQALVKDMRANPKKFLTHQAGPVLSAPETTGGQRRRFRLHAGRERRDRGSAPPRHPDRHHADGQRRGVRRRRPAGAGDADARYRLPPGAGRRAVAADAAGRCRGSVPQLLAALARREIRPYDELAAQVRRILDAGIAPDPPGYPQAHAPGAAGAGCGGAPGRGVRHPLGAPAVRFSAERAARHGAADEAADQRRAGPAAPPLPPRARRGTAAAPPTTSPASRSPAASAPPSWWNCWPRFRRARPS